MIEIDLSQEVVLNFCVIFVARHHKAIQCDFCDLWVHCGCNDVSDTKYEHLKTDLDPWFCLVCCLEFNLENVPFTRCDNSELSNINYSNSMRFPESLPNVEIVNEALKFTNISSNDASFELPPKSCSKYYTIMELQLLNISSNLNIFHTNIKGFESKLDNLNEFLSGISYKIDVTMDSYHLYFNLRE